MVALHTSYRSRSTVDHLDHTYPAVMTSTICVRTYPSQETCPRPVRLHTVPTRQYELDHTDHTDQKCIFPELQYIDHHEL